MFLDEAIIDVRGGDGGRGCVSWRREKYVPKGGPDGGDGGRGGDILLMADENTDTLSDFTSRKRFEAGKGLFGRGKNQRGRDGADMVLKVPPGCVIYILPNDGEPQLLGDLAEHGDQLRLARGGRGGYGNAHFVSSVRQRPDFAELGEPGEERKIKLELKLIADVGIIGYPSVGKSTLISVVSGARPKIADYPFTTLVPNLGVASVGDRSFIVCDVPGLIEGASEGKGLGDTFLKHIERCGVLLHVLDLSRALREGNAVDTQQLIDDHRTIRRELEAYSPLLTEKRELVLLNKIDLLGNAVAEIERALEQAGIRIFLSISSATKKNIDELLHRLLPIVLEEREKRATLSVEDTQPDVLPVLRPHMESERMGAFRVTKRSDGAIDVRGKRIEQLAKMTDFKSRGGVLRFRDVVNRIGLMKAITRLGWTEDTPVYIGDTKVDMHL